MKKPTSIFARARWLFPLILLAIGPPAAVARQTPSTLPEFSDPFETLYAPDNLVAWCIVPFDARRRDPIERAAMLQRLGIKRLAYDYRAEHIPTFAAEIAALREANIELFAWWFPATLNAEARGILDLLKRENVKTQLWVTGSGGPADDSPQARQQHIAAEVARLAEIADAAAEIGCTVGLYNHGGWYGEPENQLALIAALDHPNVGIVYNLHHAHPHLERLPQILDQLLPHLLCLNLNGMTPGADTAGQKILPIGAGTLDLAILQAIAASGYRGPIGVLNHTELDAEARLDDNLAGLQWLTALQRGKTPSPPRWETWPTVSDQVAAPDGWRQFEQSTVQQLIDRATQDGDPQRGLTVFANLKTSCFSCHQIREHGGTIGPRLDEIVAERTPQQLVESLFWPNRHVEPAYQPVMVTTIDGKTLRGYRTAGDDRSLTLADPATGQQHQVETGDIDELRTGQSLMPDGLMAALTTQQQADLVSLLLQLKHPEQLDWPVIESVLSHAVAHRPETFEFDRRPLQPDRWPHWQHPVNRDRLYDFYAKQAEYFRARPHGPLLAAYPGLDGGADGHWGNQNEETWRGDLWQHARLGSVQCGVFHGDGVVVPRGICVRLGDQGQYATCFNPDTLAYEILWQGFVALSDVRQGFLDGLRQDGATVARPAAPAPDGGETAQFQGFYRHGDQVVFAYRLNGVDYLDAPQLVDGQLHRLVAPRDEHPLVELTRGGPAQWPQTLETKIQLSGAEPYAIDTIELPTDNPWQATLFGSGHAFLPNGSALMVTMTGDVWHVSGFAGTRLDGETSWPATARWRRFAAGLHQPLGIVIDDDGIFVMCRDQLMRLQDLNGDGEADFYQCYSNRHNTSPAGHDFICGLERDAAGSFYTASGNQGLIQFSPDGQTVNVLATGFRNPDGLGLYPDGVVTVPCSEGDWTPASMICAVPVPPAGQPDPVPFYGHGGPRDGRLPQLPLAYLPRGIDNSAGGQVHIDSDRWGPLQGRMVHLSYGMNSHFLLLRDDVHGQLQGAVVPLPGEFLSGAHRGRFHPLDGQLYVSGMGGWGQYSTDIGCFQRVRYTGRPVQLPIGFHVHENGIAIRFSQNLDQDIAADPANHFAQCWNYRYSGAYGSPEFSTGHYGVIGHDALQILAAHVLDDGRTLFLELPELQPVNQLHLRLNVDPQRGQDLFVTVHRLDEPRTDFPGYRPRVKQVARHPLESDVALITQRKPNPWSAPIDGARQLKISAGQNLTYAPTELRAQVGEVLALTFDNPDVVPHNWVLAQPGSLERLGQLANRLVADPDAFINHYVPDSSDVICHTGIVEPGQTATIYVHAPDAPGRYPYLCTFPGHWMVMNGVLIIE